jgi:hypothetical protein
MRAVIALLAALAVATLESDFERSIAHVSRALSTASEIIHDAPGEGYSAYVDEALIEAQDEIDAAVRRHGPRPRLQALIAECLLRRGRAEQAFAVYRQLGRQFAPVAYEKSLRAARAMRAIRQVIRNGRLIRVTPIPGRTRLWAALCGSNDHTTLGPEVVYVTGRVVLCRLDRGEEKATILSDSGELWSEVYGMRDAQFAVTPLDRSGALAIVLSETHTAANCLPTRVVVFRLVGERMRRVGVFHGVHPSHVWWSKRQGGLVVSCVPTYKLYWMDHYLWRGKRFVYANGVLPEAVSQEDRDDLRSPARPPYTGALWEASYALTLGKRQLALQRLIAARGYCERLLAPNFNRDDDPAPYNDYGMYGDQEENLKEINRRIRWLMAGDLNHALLYRPYDFDLQVPPYKLGRAGELDGR